MQLSLFDKSEWAVAALLELSVFILALRRKLYERQPLLTTYLGLLVGLEGAMWLTYRLAGVPSSTALYAYFSDQSLLLLFRWASIYEICRVLLKPLAGIWKLCLSFLIVISTAIALSALFAASHTGPRVSAIVSTAGRGLELAIVSVLLFGLAFSRYYRVTIPRYLVWICVGLGFYSVVQVVNNTFLNRFLLSYFPVWKYVGPFSFDIAVVLWGLALLKPLPQVQMAPATLSADAYELLAPQMTSRLRELNARLLEMWK